jgi:hypothetical protein
MPVVLSSGKVLNVDPTIASKMDGLEIVEDEDGNREYRELRPGRCIYCEGTECTRTPTLVGIGINPKWYIEFYKCEGKVFKGKEFIRNVPMIQEKILEHMGKDGITVCPRCKARKLSVKTFEINKGLWLYVFYKCENCGWDGETMWLTEAGKKQKDIEELLFK